MHAFRVIVFEEGCKVFIVLFWHSALFVVAGGREQGDGGKKEDEIFHKGKLGK